MKIRFANELDIEKIAKNNIKLAFESENKSIEYFTVCNGIRNIINDNKKGFYLIAENKNKIIGQLMVTYEWSDWNNKNIWWIQSVYVCKENRKKKVFKNLINYVKLIAKENNILYLKLYVYKDNEIAKIAYEKIGMKKEYYDLYMLNL